MALTVSFLCGANPKQLISPSTKTQAAPNRPPGMVTSESSSGGDDAADISSTEVRDNEDKVNPVLLSQKSNNTVLLEGNVIDDANHQELLSPPTKDNKEAVLTDSNKLGTNSGLVKGTGNKGSVSDESHKHGPIDVQPGPEGAGRDDDIELFNEDNSKRICVKLLYSHWAHSAAVIVFMGQFFQQLLGTGDNSTLCPIPMNGKKHGPVPMFDCKRTIQLTKYHKTLLVLEDPEVGSFIAVIFTVGWFKDSDHFIVLPNIQVVLCLGDKKDDLIEARDILKSIQSLHQFRVTGHKVIVKKEIEVEGKPLEDNKDMPYV
ncbi:hypothetical protein EDD85DRAFT_962575 [Armillaria nabsnona]|nr:hypothetical protein EDD85DRAFT_962575 [Armillaria nabsnona]